MLSTSALLNESTALAEGSQKTFSAAQRISSNLKPPGDNEPDNQQKRTSRLVATNHNINDVDWLQGLNEDIAWIKGDPIQEISQQLKQSRETGNTINELHIVAHGSNGDIKLGNTFLTKQYLEESAHLLQSWRLEAIYLWSCEAGLNPQLLADMQKYTGTDIYFSKTNIGREQPNISNEEGKIASIEELIGVKKLQDWKGTLFAAPFLGKAASSYQEISIDKDNALSPPSGVTITAQTLIDDGAGNISLSSASSSHISTHEWPHGFGVTGSLGGGDTTEIAYHNASGLSEKLTIEFDEIVPEIGFATAWLALVENDGVYKMYREGTLVKTGAVDGVTDRVDPPVNLSSDDGYGFDKIEFTANGWESDYLIHKITFDAPKADNAGTASVDELDDASNQDIASQTGSLSVSDADNAGTITASIVGDPIITLNGSSYTLPASAIALKADGAMSISPTSQAWGGSWTPITWTYNPASADLDFIPAGQNLVIGYDIRLNDGTNNSNTVRVEITIVGENDVPSISDATYTLGENTAAGTIFHDTDEDSTGNDTDIESETITYSITAGNPDGIFSIDSNTGEISITAGKSLDYEIDDQHILTVKASDATESNTANVTINVNNVRPKIAITDDDADNSLSKDDTSTITFTLTEASTDFVQSDVTVSGGILSNWNAASSTVYTATFTPTAESTTNGEIHVANDKFSDGAGHTNQDEDEANNTVTFTVDTTESPTSSSTSSSPSTSSSTPIQDTNQKQGDIYLLLDTSTSMLHSEGKDHRKFQCLIALEAFAQDTERAGYQFQRRDTNSIITSKQLLQTLANQTTTQAIQELDKYTIIDNPNDTKNADNLNIHLITYNYHVQHNTFSLSRTNPNSGIDTMQAILSLKMAGEQIGNALKDNSKWKELGLPNPNRNDLFQGDPDRPSNLYAGTELLGALEGLDYLLNNKANDPNRRDQSTAISLILDGRPERRSWWDTRTNSASDSITGLPIPLPESLGKEDITTSGLLYDTEGNPNFFKNNQGQWQWKEMQNDLNAALDHLATYSADPTKIQINAYGLNNTGSTSLAATYQDLFSNQTFDNTAGGWSYSHQIIQSLQDIYF